MRWVDLRPARMARACLVVPRTMLREALVEVADFGAFEPDEAGLAEGRAPEGAEGAAQRLLREAGRGEGGAPARLLRARPDLAALAEAGAWDLLAGEAVLERRAMAAIERDPGAVIVGWTPESRLDELSLRLAHVGTSVIRLPHPPGAVAPSLVPAEGVAGRLHPLVRTYSVVPYADLDPTYFAVGSWMLMFGMMFGDVGHGLILVALGIWLGRSRWPRLGGLGRSGVFLVGAGLSATAFGFLYGECFGPTGILAPIWLSPLEEPIELLTAAIGVGAVLLGISYALGIVNRWREGGPGAAVYAASGIAGAALFGGAALAAAGWLWDEQALLLAGLAAAIAGVLLIFVGYAAAAGWGAAGSVQAGVEAFDQVIRLGANVLSFARLAAFGLTHAAIGWVVWMGVTALWGEGWLIVAALVLFVVGSAAAFALGVLVVAVQALRLEYYELFSRIFSDEGVPFRPWHLPITQEGSS
jgi:V/A-type H+/Na+-transporting ATPase subunit I